MATVKTLSKGQIVIPAEIRKKHHIEPGTEMQIMDYGGIIYLIPLSAIRLSQLAAFFQTGLRLSAVS